MVNTAVSVVFRVVSAIGSRRAAVDLGKGHAELRRIAETAFGSDFLHEPVCFHQQLSRQLHTPGEYIGVQVAPHDRFEFTGEVGGVIIHGGGKEREGQILSEVRVDIGGDACDDRIVSPVDEQIRFRCI